MQNDSSQKTSWRYGYAWERFCRSLPFVFMFVRKPYPIMFLLAVGCFTLYYVSLNYAFVLLTMGLPLCTYNLDLNMRLFEVLASGSMLITKKIPNGQSDLFRDGEHLVEYTSTEDLLDKVDYYLKHEDERLKIARAGQELALTKHTYKNRVDKLLETIMVDRSSPGTALVRSMSRKDVHKAYADIYSMFRLADPILDEIAEAKEQKISTFRLYIQLIKSLLRRINIITPFTPNAKKQKKVL